MNPIATPGVSALAAALTPRSNYAARSAQRQEAVQIGGILAAQEEKKALEAQQSQAAADAFIAQANSMPFVGRDIQKFAQAVKGEERAYFERLRDNYQGDIRKMWAAEGETWQAGAAQRLRSTPAYMQASENRKNVLSSQIAREKGEYLVGSQQGNTYQSGEQQLADFLAGKTDTYDHRGSYKPEDAVKGLREQYAPGRYSFERVQATPDEVYNHLVSTHGAEVGGDYYNRTYKNVPVFYKTAPLEKAIAFQRDNLRFGMEQERMQMSRQDQFMQRQAFNSSERLKGKQGQLLDAKIAEKNGLTASGIPFDQEFFNYATSKIDLRHEPGVKKQLPHSGFDVSQVRSLSGRTLYGDSDQAVARQLGMQRQKDGTYTRGNITEGFSPDNGTGVFDLKNSRFHVLSLEPTLYFDPAQVRPGGLDPSGVNGYAKVRVQFNSDADATAAGLYNERWGWLPDSSTKAGTGVYSPNDSDNVASTRTATLLVPIGKVNAQHNKPFMYQLHRSVMGQKAANDAAVDMPYMGTGF